NRRRRSAPRSCSGSSRAEEVRPDLIEGVSVSYADKTLTCRDCGQPFVFSAGEQEFYASRGLMNEPGRCPSCRQQRRSSSSSTGYASSGGYSAGGGYGQREMYTAICSNCGKEARVPFQPRTDRPVYCSDCFQQVRGARSSY